MKLLTNVKRVIFHHSQSNIGNVKIIRDWHKERGFSDIGYHFVILSNGKTEAGRPMIYQGAHARGKNHDSIGVCLVGNFHHYAVKYAQIVGSANLFKALKTVWPKLYIDYHIKSKSKTCPGEWLDRKEFKQALLVK